ncbi:hypothetical protein CYMTET_17056 [Cymbomonas tetramitiformis]|uniref:Zinc finger PHD-type domain-containing protein n=1 Tax=Cymbomonas tetramitiformis TaxID=36881 RepID=A0AAE0L7B7_9CHLO|nr:hypothetical protein CYMTET_17056 [Cymbomonas tetramitiformis]
MDPHLQRESIFLSNGTSLRDFCAAINAGVSHPQGAAGALAAMAATASGHSGRGRPRKNGSVGGKVPRGRPPSMAATPLAARSGKEKDGRKERDNGKHKRLFSHSLSNGMQLSYVAQDETLLRGTVAGSGILCECCNNIISCSQFEAHAGRGSRRAPYDNIYTADGRTLRKIAALLPDEDEPQTQVEADGLALQMVGTSSQSLMEGGQSPAKEKGGEMDLQRTVARCRTLLSELDSIAGGCVLCRCSDFQKDGFGARTIMICDQCEREFHVGCLQRFKGIGLSALPEGDWFCGHECQDIQVALKRQVARGVQPVYAHMPEAAGGPTWQLIHGRESSARLLQTASSILQESFEPIRDLASGQNLVPMMVHSETEKEHDFQGMYTIILNDKGKPVTVATLRVFGRHLAEMPLVATLECARRQGHCRSLMHAVETFLSDLTVHRLCLPAAVESEPTWRDAFGFRAMTEEHLRVARSELRILIFPDARMLDKVISDLAPNDKLVEALPVHDLGELFGSPTLPASQEKGECLAAPGRGAESTPRLVFPQCEGTSSAADTGLAEEGAAICTEARGADEETRQPDAAGSSGEQIDAEEAPALSGRSQHWGTSWEVKGEGRADKSVAHETLDVNRSSIDPAVETLDGHRAAEVTCATRVQEEAADPNDAEMEELFREESGEGAIGKERLPSPAREMRPQERQVQVEAEASWGKLSTDEGANAIAIETRSISLLSPLVLSVIAIGDFNRWIAHAYRWLSSVP